MPAHSRRLAARQAHGQWLRQQREARGWSITQMRRKLREAAKTAGDTLPSNECLNVMIRRWEDGRSGMSERYRLHYCGAFQIPVEGFGDRDAGPTAIDEQRPRNAGPALSPADQHRLWFLTGYVSCLLATATKEHNGTR